MKMPKMAQNVTFNSKKVNSDCQIHNQNALFSDKRNVLSHFRDVHFVILQSPFVSQWLWESLFALYHFRYEKW